MHEAHLFATDLNLLVALHVLLDECSVTRAAARLGRTQPAMSRTLARLRETLADPLLVREGAGLRPTPRAERLRGPVLRILNAIEVEILAGEVFEPGTAQRTFCLAAADFAESTLLPQALARVSREAPLFDLVIEGADVGLAELTARVDLLIAPRGTAASSLRSLRLGDEPFACLVWEGHPFVGGLDLDAYVSCPHILVAPRGNPGGYVDDRLAAMGRSRRVAVRTRSFLSAPRLLVGTDRVLTMPRRTAELAAGELPVRLLDVPLHLPPFTLHLVWHERWHHDAAHVWLRRTLADEIRPLLD